jgi:hypothetical protein
MDSVSKLKYLQYLFPKFKENNLKKQLKHKMKLTLFNYKFNSKHKKPKMLISLSLLFTDKALAIPS